jgi:hypothetical protein
MSKAIQDKGLIGVGIENIVLPEVDKGILHLTILRVLPIVGVAHMVYLNDFKTVKRYLI